MHLDRRQFVEKAIGGIASLGAATTVIAAEPEQPTSPPIEANSNAAAAAAAADDDDDATKVASEELMLLSLILHRYPSEKFDGTAVRGIFQELRADLARGRILSQFPLKNSDPPSIDFRPLQRQKLQ